MTRSSLTVIVPPAPNQIIRKFRQCHIAPAAPAGARCCYRDSARPIRRSGNSRRLSGFRTAFLLSVRTTNSRSDGHALMNARASADNRCTGVPAMSKCSSSPTAAPIQRLPLWLRRPPHRFVESCPTVTTRPPAYSWPPLSSTLLPTTGRSDKGHTLPRNRWRRLAVVRREERQQSGHPVNEATRGDSAAL